MDPYEILGVHRNSSKDEIKKKYKQMAIKWHPDKNNDPDAGKIFNQINEAYSKLMEQPKPMTFNFNFNHVATPGSFCQSISKTIIFNDKGEQIIRTKTMVVKNGKKIEQVLESNQKTREQKIYFNY